MRSLVTLSLAVYLTAGTAAISMAAESTPSEPPESSGPTTSVGRTAVTGSGFSLALPDDWAVELAEPDPNVFEMAPGTAWEALRASAPDGHMACSLVVGVSEAPFFDPPHRAGSALGQGGVEQPYWDTDEPHLLWVPEPVVPNPASFMQITWDRLQDEDEGLAGDAAYSLLCVTSDPLDTEPGGAFVQLMDTFEFLPARE